MWEYIKFWVAAPLAFSMSCVGIFIIVVVLLIAISLVVSLVEKLAKKADAATEKPRDPKNN